jgi:acyl carrier protein
MTNQSTRDRLTRCFLTYFTELSPEEVPRASMTSVGEWDSMAAVTLIGLVSEEFGIEVAPDDYEHFVSYELILHYLENRQHVS